MDCAGWNADRTTGEFHQLGPASGRNPRRPVDHPRGRAGGHPQPQRRIFGIFAVPNYEQYPEYTGADFRQSESCGAEFSRLHPDRERVELPSGGIHRLDHYQRNFRQFAGELRRRGAGAGHGTGESADHGRDGAGRNPESRFWTYGTTAISDYRRQRFSTAPTDLDQPEYGAEEFDRVYDDGERK